MPAKTKYETASAEMDVECQQIYDALFPVLQPQDTAEERIVRDIVFSKWRLDHLRQASFAAWKEWDSQPFSKEMYKKVGDIEMQVDRMEAAIKRGLRKLESYRKRIS